MNHLSRFPLCGLLLVMMMSVGCRRQGDHFSQASAREAAESFYASLISGRYDEYVMAHNGADSLPTAYRSQLVDLAGQFMAQQQSARGGILSATATNDTLMEADSSARVYLDIVFADSLCEQVSLPLLFRDGKWRLR